jgi:hypothetical protein
VTNEEQALWDRFWDRFDDMLIDAVMTGVPAPADAKDQEWAWAAQYGSLHGFKVDVGRFPDANGNREDGKEHRWMPNI